MIKQAVILAGGLGTRMKPYTETVPKPMIEVGGKPFLWYIIDYLKRSGIKEIILCVSYKHEVIKDYFGNGSNFGINIKYSIEPKPLGTGGALKLAKNMLDKKFVLLYGDNFWPLIYLDIFRIYEKFDTLGFMVVYDGPKSTKDNVRVRKEGYLEAYDKSRTSPGLKGIDGGLLIFKKEIVNMLPEGESSLEENVYNKLIQNKQFSAFVTKQRYFHVSLSEKLKEVEESMKQYLSEKIIFLDRDGVINKKMPEGDYVKNWKEFEFLPGAIEAIRLLNEKMYTLVLISNQPGIGRGVMTKKDLDDINTNMEKAFAKKGAHIDYMYFCLHKRDDNCECRKPKPGLVIQAAKELNIYPEKAMLIGDDDRDMELAKHIGCKGYQVTKKRSFLSIAKGIVNS